MGNGQTKALVHRVSMTPTDDSVSRPSSEKVAGRQSHIFFLQPDWDTIVKPLPQYLSGMSTDLPPIKYGNWHRKKVSLAFGLPPHPQAHVVAQVHRYAADDSS